MPNIPYLSGIDWLSWMGPTMFWIGWGSLGLLISLFSYGFYHVLSYPFKMDVVPLFGSGTDGHFAPDKKKWNRAKWNKDNTKWKMLFPLFKGKEIEPFDSEYIYPGKRCYAFMLNEILVPGRININFKEDKFRAEVNPVPYNIRHWQSLKHKEHAQEFSEATWWDQNKAFVYMLIAIFICCTMCVLTIYLTYKQVGGIVAPMKSLTQAVNNMGLIK